MSVESNRVLSGNLPDYKRREVAPMDTYQVITVLFLFGSFLIALLTYIDREK